MKCPVCQEFLLTAHRERIEIDYCPKCRGVWLDRGELNALIERSTRDDVLRFEHDSQPAPNHPRTDDDSGEFRKYRPSEDPYGRGYGGGYREGKRRKSFWSELFDFD